MSNSSPYRRRIFDQLTSRLGERPSRRQVVSGPRQVGKTTVVRQALEAARRPQPLRQRRRSGAARRRLAGGAVGRGTAPGPRPLHRGHSCDRRDPEDPRLVRDREAAVGSRTPFDGLYLPPRRGAWLLAHLLVRSGLTESLAGRFERIVPVTHWSLAEIRDAFGFDAERYLYLGGYPGAAAARLRTPRHSAANT